MQLGYNLFTDGQGKPIIDSDWGVKAEKLMTFDGATENDPGDYNGTGNPATLFTVTGTVLLRLLAVCQTAVVGASATLEVGHAGSTAKLIAQTTAANIIANEIWHDNSPDSSVELSSVLVENILANGLDIIQTVGTANITSGVIRYTALWYPLSINAKVVAA